jgi:hypothetical protein
MPYPYNPEPRAVNVQYNNLISISNSSSCIIWLLSHNNDLDLLLAGTDPVKKLPVHLKSLEAL